MPRWPRPRDREHERFARAVDLGNDPEFGDELRVVSALRRLGTSTPLDDEARKRIAEQVAEPAPRTRRRPRLAPALAAGFVLLLAVTGIGLLFAEGALPGEPLYELKRVREATVLELTFDDESRALKHLEYAARRIDELSQLAEQDARNGYAVAFDDFAGDARAGVSQLTALATSSGGSQLGTLRTWAEAQSARLAALRPVLPVSAAGPRDLLIRIGQRASALDERMDCYQITSGDSDELGALPATGTCSAPDALRPGGGRPPSPGDVVREPLVADPVDTPSGPQATPHVPLTVSPTPSAPTPPPTTTSSAVPPPIPAPTSPRLPGSTPAPTPPGGITIPPLLPGLPEVTVG